MNLDDFCFKWMVGILEISFKQFWNTQIIFNTWKRPLIKWCQTKKYWRQKNDVKIEKTKIGHKIAKNINFLLKFWQKFSFIAFLFIFFWKFDFLPFLRFLCIFFIFSTLTSFFTFGARAVPGDPGRNFFSS